MEKGVPIRSLSRGIAVLQAINRGGPISMMEIARTSNVPYPTACRLVQTLVHEGLVEREPSRKNYRPTALVQTLAHGFQGHAELVQFSRPHIVELTRKLGWPISLASHVGHSMIIRDSTHSLTTLTFNSYYPGYALPILECAAGLVYLSYLPDDERQGLLDALKLMPDKITNHVIDLFEKEGLAEHILRDGHATRAYNTFTRNPGKTSSIAVPIIAHGHVAGTLTLAFFATALKMSDALAQCLEPLKAAARRIGEEMTNPPTPLE
jgi:IclR family transcriptional regulator, mhp operon transcriptional activator